MEGKPATQVMESDLLNGILPQPVLPAIVFLCQAGKVFKKRKFSNKGGGWVRTVRQSRQSGHSGLSFLSVIKPSILRKP